MLTVQITTTFLTHCGFFLISLMPLLHLQITIVREIMIVMTVIVASAEIRTSCSPIVTFELLASAAEKKDKISVV